jgi:hypothetical protein
MNGKTQTQKILNNICNKCIYIIKNSQLISSQQDISESTKSQHDLQNPPQFDTLSENTEITMKNKTCKFCFGILNPQNFKIITDKIFAEIGNHEYKDYKITTNFSPLFQLSIAYVRYFLNFCYSGNKI